MIINIISPKLKESFTEQFTKHLDSERRYVTKLSNCYTVPPVLWLAVCDHAAGAESGAGDGIMSGHSRIRIGQGDVTWRHTGPAPRQLVSAAHHVYYRQTEPRWWWKYLVIIQHFPVSVNKPGGHLVTEWTAASHNQDRLAEAGRAPRTGLKLCCVITKTFLG